MAKQQVSGFDDAASIFADYGTTLRGFVRYKLTHRNLEPYLPADRSLTILDVGGGSGPDAAWLAHLGHNVTMLEPSEEQRIYASRRFNFFLDEADRDRITILPHDASSIPKKTTYDVVLMHGVALYQPDPSAFITAILALVKPGGIVSVLEKGYYGAEARAIREVNFANLHSLQRKQRMVNHLDQDVYAFYPDELEQCLAKSAMDIINWYGVRVVTDGLDQQVSTMDSKRVKEIIAVEYEQGRNPAIRGQAQLLHFIARKKT